MAKIQSSDKLFPEPKAGAEYVTNLFEQSAHALAYSSVQRPITGLTQLVRPESIPLTSFIPKLQEVEPLSAQWHAQALGNAAGTMIDLAIMASLFRKAVPNTYIKSPSGFMGLSHKELATMVGIQGSILSPHTEEASALDAFRQRATGFASSYASFLVMSKANARLLPLVPESKSRALATSIAMTASVPGAMVGNAISIASDAAYDPTKIGLTDAAGKMGLGVYEGLFTGAFFGLMSKPGEARVNSDVVALGTFLDRFKSPLLPVGSPQQNPLYRDSVYLGRAEQNTAFLSRFDRTDNIDLPNFAAVSANLWRSGRPSLQGLFDLREKGAKTIVNLRGEHHGTVEGIVAPLLGMNYYRIPVNEFAPLPKDVADRLVSIARDPKNCPVVVHCKYGQDRTGIVSALLRNKIDSLSAEAAWTEMLAFGIHSGHSQVRHSVADMIAPDPKTALKMKIQLETEYNRLTDSYYGKAYKRTTPVTSDQIYELFDKGY